MRSDGPTGKGAKMASKTYTYKCPQHVCVDCQGDEVAFVVTKGQVRIAACKSLQAQGWGKQPQVVDRYSNIGRYLPTESVGYIHKDGLVTIR